MPFLVLFIIIPIMELVVFAAVSEHIGLLTALLFALLTAIVGGNIVRLQGMHTIVSMRESMDAGRLPLTELFDGFCLVFAGALLITPGFLTDTLGFLLLIPRIRAFLRHIVKNHTDWAVETQGFEYQSQRDPDIIEGEFVEIDEEEKR